MHRQLIVALGLIERDGKILIMRRHDPEHAQWHQRWEFPGGKIDKHETPLQALHREVKEETGLEVDSATLLGVYTHHWDTPTGIQQTFMLVYHCPIPEGAVILSPEENDAYLWATVEEIKVLPGLLDGCANILNECFQTENAIRAGRIRGLY